MLKGLETECKECDIAIIGSGPAGLTAGIYAARGSVKTVLLEGDEPGGQLMYTQSIENFPGKIDTGFGLVDSMKKQAASFGVEFLATHVHSISMKEEYFVLTCKTGVVAAKAVIVATGSNARWLNLPNEEKFRGNGISTCATCDGFAVRGKTAAIVGGGNTAAEDAIYLSNLCEKVFLIHRRDSLRAEKILQDKLFSLGNIEVLWNEQIEAYLGEEELTGLLLASGRKLPVDGLFVAIGHVPNTAFVKDLLPTDEFGYLKTNGVETKIPGLFAAGDVMDPTDRQAITAAGYGCSAARKALQFLQMKT